MIIFIIIVKKMVILSNRTVEPRRRITNRHCGEFARYEYKTDITSDSKAPVAASAILTDLKQPASNHGPARKKSVTEKLIASAFAPEATNVNGERGEAAATPAKKWLEPKPDRRPSCERRMRSARQAEPEREGHAQDVLEAIHMRATDGYIVVIISAEIFQIQNRTLSSDTVSDPDRARRGVIFSVERVAVASRHIKHNIYAVTADDTAYTTLPWNKESTAPLAMEGKIYRAYKAEEENDLCTKYIFRRSLTKLVPKPIIVKRETLKQML